MVSPAASFGAAPLAFFGGLSSFSAGAGFSLLVVFSSAAALVTGFSSFASPAAFFFDVDLAADLDLSSLVFFSEAFSVFTSASSFLSALAAFGFADSRWSLSTAGLLAAAAF